MDWKQIREEYEQSTITLKELAAKYGISEGTMRSRKNREKWQRNATENATQRATKKKDVATEKKSKKQEPKTKRVTSGSEVKDDETIELTEKQNLFCLYFVKYWSATKAYQKAYECGYNTANAEGYKLLVKPCVKKEIDRLKKNIRDGIGLEAMAVLQKYVDTAFADIGDYVRFGQREVPVMGPFGPLYEGKGKNRKPITQIVNYIDLKESIDLDSSLISEVKMGSSGTSIKLLDKMKAFEKLEKYLDLLPDHHKRRMEEERLKIEQAKFDLEKKKNLEDPEDTKDDGFIEAMKADVQNIWADEIPEEGSKEPEGDPNG